MNELIEKQEIDECIKIDTINTNSVDTLSAYEAVQAVADSATVKNIAILEGNFAEECNTDSALARRVPPLDLKTITSGENGLKDSSESGP